MTKIVACTLAIALTIAVGLGYRTMHAAQETATDLRNDRDRFCGDIHSDLYSLKSALPQYERHVRRTHRPETDSEPLYMLLRASQVGLYQSLRYCLRDRDDVVSTLLRDFRDSATAEETRTLIDKVMELLAERYSIPSVPASDEESTQ